MGFDIFQREKLFKCLVSLQFLRTHTKQNIVNLYQKDCLGVSMKISKCGHLIT